MTAPSPSRTDAAPAEHAAAAILLNSRRVLVLHAHPDDESLATGGTLAFLASRGAGVTLVTGTRGERGEVVPGPLKGLEGSRALASTRERELRAATEALDVAQQLFLGAPGARAPGRPYREYVDSGMRWLSAGIAGPAADVPADALSVASLAEVVADVIAVIHSMQPDLVITYDEGGGYGHPDHVRMHDAGVLAAAAAGVSALLIVPAREDGSGGPGSDFELSLDIRPWLGHKRDALRAHRTQLTVDGDRFTLAGGQVHTIDPVEYYRLARP